MYELSVHRVFCAAHAIDIRGEREPTHGHNWSVAAVVEGETLDADGLLCDFHDLERHIDEILAPLNNVNLNDTPPFDTVNPTAEHVARYLADELATRLPAPVRVRAVSVTEAPGCAATYRPRP
jgi:6-pyruvoyltetrahydropterin/6-carboxytetrahydropterin synthase